MTSTPYLINIAVGPVQEFIASARKLRDLWYGSHLLSELSKAVAASLSSQGCELVFPGGVCQADLHADSALNVANKILAVAPPGGQPEQLVATAKAACQERWQKICEEAAGRVQIKELNRNLFDSQAHDFGEFFAAWVPLEDGKYQLSRRQSERKLAGRKALRDFQAPTWNGAGLPKSSLDGVREAVLSDIAEDDSRAFQLKQGEHLDALGVVKRFGPWNDPHRPHFDNMAQVAARTYLAGLQKAARENVRIAELIPSPELVAALYPQGNPLADKPVWDGTWPKQLSSELLIPSVLEEALRPFGDTLPEPWKKLRSTLKELWQTTAHPLPYGCLLLGDGDNMGKALDAISDKKEHQLFSAELDTFARGVRTIAKTYDGQVVYSGGDDVLAYVPLHSALACAAAFNQRFGEIMAGVCTGLGIEQPTFSLGLVIVHHHTPLHKALDLARQAERYAKDQGGKDCLAVIQDKRGGSPLSVCGKWRGNNNLPDRLSRFCRAYRNNSLSSRLAYQLRGIARQCGSRLQWNGIEPGNTACAEALRLVGRKLDKSSKALLPDDAAYLMAGQTDLRQLTDELVVAHQLAQAARLAEGDWNKEKV